MSTVIESYKKAVANKTDGDVMGVVRTLFPDIAVETFLERKAKKSRKARKNNNVKW